MTNLQQPLGLPDGSPAIDLKAEMRRAANSLGSPLAKGAKVMTSDLSIDEELVLHSIGWEPVELVNGVSFQSVPVGVWTWGQGEIKYASHAYLEAFRHASAKIQESCSRAAAAGVVGVDVSVSVHPHYISVELVGTAVRAVNGPKQLRGAPFVSDLSARDFALILRAGWKPLGLAAGASFVYAPRRSAGAVLQQKSQNVELTNFTEAMYSARESAMERMQSAAIVLGGSGVVEVKVTEGPMAFAHHVVRFSAYGTVVHLEAGGHNYQPPHVVVPLDDPAPIFDVKSLR